MQTTGEMPMPIRTFIKSLTSTSTTRRPTRRSAPGARLSVELLEDRRVLSFGPLVSVPYGSPFLPDAVMSADVNGDGRPDIVTSTVAGLDVRLGNGDGTFRALQHSATSGRPLVASDLNGDARTDLVAITESDLRVLPGNGDGTFQSPQVVVLPSQLPAGSVGYSSAQTPTSAAVADLDGDGHPDLIAGGYDIEGLPDGSFREDDYVNVAFGTAAGSFGPITAYRVASTFNTVHTTGVQGVRDFDGDGQFDVLMNDHGRLSLFAGNGDGTLQGSPRVSDVGFSGAEPSRVADFDRDGVLDVLSGFNAVSVMRGNGDGTFSPGEPASFGPLLPTIEGIGNVAVADVNVDGNLDVVGMAFSDDWGGFYSDSYTTFSARVLLGDGTGSFGSPIISDFGTVFGTANVVSAVLADFAGDELPELAWAEAVTPSGVPYGVLAVALNDGIWTPPPPTPPSIAIGDVTITEGNTGTRAAGFPVTLSRASGQPVTVNYATADDTATAGSDYQAASGTLTFAPGETSKTISVPVTGDRRAEADESFVVTLSGEINATLANIQGAGRIVDDEPRIRISDVSKAEGTKGQTTSFTFTVTLSAAYDQAVTMSFRTANGTAKTSDGDYVARTGTLTFAPGETTKTVTITVKGDGKKESDETFYLDLFGNSGNSLFAKSRGVGTILNDD
jgi:Calx-beta domain/FG-GAP-like repeat